MSTHPDLFQTERVALQLEVGYDLAQYVLALVTHHGGHVSIFERRHRHGTYRLSINVPSKHRKEFEPYETKS